MNNMQISRSVLLFGIIGSLILTLVFTDGIQNQNGSVMSSPLAFAIALLCGFLAIWLPRKSRYDDPSMPVGLWERFWASQIDSLVVSWLVISIIVLISLIVEYIATGYWQWSYHRETFKARDLAFILQMCGALYLLYYYFYKHAALGRPTPGQYILGYRIIPADSGEPNYKSRVFYGAIAASLSIITLILSRNVKDGVYWWDENSNTRAVSTD